MELRSAVEDIITSYEERIETINTIFDNAGIMLGEFHETVRDTRVERDKIKTELRDTLARNESLRRKDFDTMMSSILASQEGREREVRALLAGYLGEQKEMAGKLKAHLSGFKDSMARGEAERLAQYQSMIRDMLSEQETRRAEITEQLRAFQYEQLTLALTFKDLLSKGRELRIKDLKSMLKELGAQHHNRLADRQERRQEVFRMLDTFRKERQEGAGQPQPRPQTIH
jgi:hypothetical protein